MLRNEAAAAMNDEIVINAFNRKHPKKKKTLQKDRELMNGAAPDMEFRCWYSADREVRKEFLIRSANYLCTVRRASMAFELYSLPEPVMFQVLIEPIPEGPPPIERRIRLYASRYPETYSFEEIEFWHEDDELSDEIRLIDEAEERASNERRRVAMLKQEKKCREMEVEICMWEDHRSELHRRMANQLAERVEIGGGGFVGKFGYFDELKKSEVVDVKRSELKYVHGTGLDNEDEFSDEKERAKAEALAKDRRKEEERLRALNEKKRKEEEERKKRLEEARYQRLRATADERKRIVKELADLKAARKKAAEDKIVADEREKKRLEQEAKDREMELEMERQEELKREQLLRDAQTWKEEERRKLRVMNEADER